MILQGRVTYRKVYVFGVAASGKAGAACKNCGKQEQNVFADVLDEAGLRHRCCMWCFRSAVEAEDLARAKKRSRYIAKVIDWINEYEALPDNTLTRGHKAKLLIKIGSPCLYLNGGGSD
jgi:hypothetical protein